MNRPRLSERDLIDAMRRAALGYPEAVEGIACKGTALEKRTIAVRKKTFLFLGAKDAMMKLGESVGEAEKLADRSPECCKVGAHGWATVTFSSADTPPLELLLGWIDESYRLLAPKKLLESLPAPKQQKYDAKRGKSRNSTGE